MTLAPARELSHSNTRRKTMSSDITIAAFIGLDWADQQHVIRLRAAGDMGFRRFRGFMVFLLGYSSTLQ